MTIRGKIMVTVCIPVAGLVAFLALNTVNMGKVTRQVESTVDQVFIPIVKKDIPEITKSNSSISLLLNADRDAYQAYVAQVEAMETFELDKLKQLDSDNQENIKQVEDRVTSSSEGFDDSMSQLYSVFKQNYATWKNFSRESLKMSLSLYETFQKRKDLMASSVTVFDSMRDCLDRIEGLLEKEINSILGDETSSKQQLNGLYDSYTLLLNADRDAYQAYLAQMQAFSCTDPEEMVSILDDNVTNIQQVADRTAKAAGVFNDDMNAIYKEFQDYYGKWKVDCANVVKLSSSSMDDRLVRRDYHEKALVAFDVFRDTINTLTEKLEARISNQISHINDVSEQAETESAEMRRLMRKDVNISVVAGIIISIISIGISLYICASIIMVLNTLINAMQASSEQVASAAGQVSSTSQSLAEGSCEQASGIEEINSSMDEISGQTTMNADNARMAHKYSQEVNDSTQKCNDAMTEMSSAINDIQKSSEETSKIVKTIDEIAFQTNLLALNAAVEAARAGEAGKGFAVVAEEVRNLAMRSAEAARSTTGMIEESVKNANNGVEIVTKVGSVLSEIAESVGQTTDYVSNISTSNDEQAAAISQIKAAIAQMDKVTQANASASEEGASAAEELTAQAETMNDIVHNLSRMVGGDNSGSKSKSDFASKPNKSLNMGDQAFHEIANSPSFTSSTTTKSSEPVAYNSSVKEHAESVIPFDDGFDEFN